MGTVMPQPVGRVRSLVGVPLHAAVELPDDESIESFEIELVPGRRSGRSRAWADPVWRVASDEPRFASVDGHGAYQGMSVGRRRPTFQVVSAEPIDAFTWELHQDGEPIESGADITTGIAPDGLRIELRPARRLRRSGRKGRPRRKGVFYPPFDSHLPDMPRSEDSRIRYTALTHAGHDAQDDHAVDFNWGSGEADRGHWVRSSAAGTVTRVDPVNGEVHVRHPRFDGKTAYETVYAHLDPVLVQEGQRVRAQQRIGRIGSTYYGDEAISPHLHYQQRREGRPLKMRLLIEGEETPIGVSRKDPGRTLVWDRKVPGWVRPRGPAQAELVVRTRRAADGAWSEPRPLRFVVAAKDDPAIGQYDGAFESEALEAPLAYSYDGPALEPGAYTLRYRAVGDAGTRTPWAYDRSVAVEPALA